MARSTSELFCAPTRSSSDRPADRLASGRIRAIAASILFAVGLVGGPVACEGGGGGSRAVDPPTQRGTTVREDDSQRGRADRRRDPRLDERGQMQTPRALVGEGPPWSIVLGTFTGENHSQVAEESVVRLVEQIPEFRGARVHHRSSGSMILWGEWPRIDDPAAQAELRRVQQYVWRDARPFAAAMLTRAETTRSAVIGPYDLRQLRRQYPNVSTLQTLQVAAWADFDGTMSLAEIRRQAEAYAARLRAEGHDAWYHHDDHLMMSVVTVGVFDHTAYDPKSTFYSDEVEALMRRFPAHLVNGEPLLVRIDPRNPRSREIAQRCHLVLVPR